MNIQILAKAAFRYRLGDMVLLGNDALKMILNPSSPFHGTIGHEYAVRTISNNRFLDFGLLREVVASHTQKHSYPVPDPVHLVLHYRGGDWKCVRENQIEELGSYVSRACAESNLNKLRIVTAFHYENKIDEAKIRSLTQFNFENLNRFVASVENLGISVEIKPNGTIDEDFCYLANAEHFIPTKGGYSILAGVCNPNHVYHSFPDTDRAILHYKSRQAATMQKGKFFRLKKFLWKNHEFKLIEKLLSDCSPVG